MNGGGACPHTKETQICNTQSCAVNCEVSAWSGWGACSKSCGGGEQVRSRTITRQPTNGGASCPVLSESQPCNTQACINPVNCEVSAWTDWGACSKSCGSGEQTRTRTLTKQPANGGSACPVLSESQPCNTQSCSTSVPYISQVFLNSTNYTLPADVPSLTMFMIGGGGGGAGTHAGGGGAGYIHLVNLNNVKSGTVFNITIGKGGGRIYANGSSFNGEDTQVVVSGMGTHVAKGGRGGGYGSPAGDGSSGGGGAGNYGYGGKGGSGGSDGVNGRNITAGKGMSVQAFNNIISALKYPAVNYQFQPGQGGEPGNNQSHSGGGGAGGIICTNLNYPTAEKGGEGISATGGVGFGAGGGAGGHNNGIYYYGGAGADGLVYIFATSTGSRSVTNCVVSDWSAWGTCSASCGGGTQTRTRTITTQPANGGSACPALSESQSCNTQSCIKLEPPGPFQSGTGYEVNADSFRGTNNYMRPWDEDSNTYWETNLPFYYGNHEPSWYPTNSAYMTILNLPTHNSNQTVHYGPFLSLHKNTGAFRLYGIRMKGMPSPSDGGNPKNFMVVGTMWQNGIYSYFDILYRGTYVWSSTPTEFIISPPPTKSYMHYRVLFLSNYAGTYYSYVSVSDLKFLSIA
jgi:hypothetical protein